MKRILETFSRILLALGFTALLLGIQPAAAQHGGQCACGRPNVPSAFEIDHGAPWADAARVEFQKWNNYANVFSWVTGDGSGGRNNKNEIIYFTPATTLSVYGIEIDNDTFGVTYINPQSAFGSPSFNACPPPAGTTCGTFTETDVIMNTSFSRGWTTGQPNYDDTGPANYGATAVHELGHAIGLHHAFNNLSTMNYYEDFAAKYLSLGDAGILRVHYPGSVRSILDIATYPFRYSGFQYSGTTVASASSSSVQAGNSFTLRNFTVENIGNINASNVRLNIYLSSDSVVTSGDYLVGTVAFDTLSTWWDTTGTTFTVPATVPAGTYYIGGIITYNQTVSDTITYNNSWVLDASRRITVLPCTDPYEPNNSLGAAYGPLGVGTVLSAKICLGTDEDWYRVNVTVPGTVSFSMSPPSGKDYDLQLYNPSGTLVASSTAGGSASESINYRASTTGTYYAKVYGFSGAFDVNNSYVLSYGFSAAPKSHDFNGDGKSDIVWRDGSGTTALWLMNGTSISSSAAIGTVPPGWALVGQRDFNGDGKHDLLWREVSSGTVAIWFLNGTSVSSTTSLGVVPTSWSVAGTCDLNGDGKGDLVWRSDTGVVALWLMNGGTVSSSASLGTVPPNWLIVGCADFNGDGKADLLWRDNTSGTVAIWFLNGTTVASSATLGSAPIATWPAAAMATGDFNADGRADILWRSNTGGVAIWLLNGSTIVSSASLGSVPGWTMVETGDFNGDSKADLLWRDGSGNTAMWFLNGTAISSTGGLGNIPTNWVIQNVNVN